MHKINYWYQYFYLENLLLGIGIESISMYFSPPVDNTHQIQQQNQNCLDTVHILNEETM